jgi:hypothetical protein
MSIHLDDMDRCNDLCEWPASTPGGNCAQEEAFISWVDLRSQDASGLPITDAARCLVESSGGFVNSDPSVDLARVTADESVRKQGSIIPAVAAAYQTFRGQGNVKRIVDSYLGTSDNPENVYNTLGPRFTALYILDVCNGDWAEVRKLYATFEAQDTDGLVQQELRLLRVSNDYVPEAKHFVYEGEVIRPDQAIAARAKSPEDALKKTHATRGNSARILDYYAQAHTPAGMSTEDFRATMPDRNSKAHYVVRHGESPNLIADRLIRSAGNTAPTTELRRQIRAEVVKMIRSKRKSGVPYPNDVLNISPALASLLDPSRSEIRES